jgi:transposase
MQQAGHHKNKSNRIDALVLARCLLTYPEDTQEVFLPQKTQAQLDQLVRQRDRIVDSLRRRKQRIQDLCEAVNPGLSQAAGGFLLTEAGRAFLRTYLDPRAVVRLGKKRLTRFLQKRYRLNLDPDLLEAIFQACKEAVQLYKPIRQAGHMPFDEVVLQADMDWELDQLEREEKRILHLENQIKACNQTLDPQDVMLSLPGVQHIIAAGIRACIGDIGRFNSLTKHRGFAGFYPSVRKTGDGESAPMPISKMSCNRYKKYLYLAAENAYKWDVDCAAFYHKRREKGHTHTQAVCAVANGKLLPRIHQLLKKLKQAQVNGAHRPQYVFRDLDGNPISKAEARAIIQAKWGNRKYAKKGLATS